MLRSPSGLQTERFPASRAQFLLEADARGKGNCRKPGKTRSPRSLQFQREEFLNAFCK